MTTEENIIDLPLQTRADVRLQSETIDAEARTVEVLWSTGATVRRRDLWTGKRYDEALSLDPRHVDLSRLNSGAPLLNAHGAFDLCQRHRRRRAGVDRREQRQLRGPRPSAVQRPRRCRAAVAGRPRRDHPQRLGRLCRPRLRGDRAGRPGAGLAGDRLAAGGAVGGAGRRRWWRRLPPEPASHALPPRSAHSEPAASTGRRTPSNRRARTWINR